MNLIKIDPQTRTVELIDNSGTLDAMCTVIDCRMIDVCARQDNGDALTVDDEALFLEPQPFAFLFGNYGQPIHGVALLAGCNEEGETTEPIMTLEQARSCIQWLGDIYTSPMLTVVPFYHQVLDIQLPE